MDIDNKYKKLFKSITYKLQCNSDECDTELYFSKANDQFLASWSIGKSFHYYYCEACGTKVVYCDDCEIPENADLCDECWETEMEAYNDEYRCPLCIDVVNTNTDWCEVCDRYVCKEHSVKCEPCDLMVCVECHEARKGCQEPEHWDIEQQ